MRKGRPWMILAGWLLCAVALFALGWLWHWRREHRYDSHIQAAAAKYDVDKFLLKALVWQESRFDPKAVSRAGALGLGQIMPATGRDWAKATQRGSFQPSDLLQPAANLDAAAWYLARALKFWAHRGPDAPALALAEYNAGRANVLRWMNDASTAHQPLLQRIGYEQTRQYVPRVLARAEHYRNQRDF